MVMMKMRILTVRQALGDGPSMKLMARVTSHSKFMELVCTYIVLRLSWVPLQLHEALALSEGSQEIPEVTGKFGLGVQNEAGKKLTEFCQGNALVIANTLFQKHKSFCFLPKTLNISRWSIPKSNWLYPLQLKIDKLYTDSKNKTRIWLWLPSWAPYCKIQT